MSRKRPPQRKPKQPQRSVHVGIEVALQGPWLPQGDSLNERALQEVNSSVDPIGARTRGFFRKTDHPAGAVDTDSSKTGCAGDFGQSQAGVGRMVIMEISEGGQVNVAVRIAVQEQNRRHGELFETPANGSSRAEGKRFFGIDQPHAAIGLTECAPHLCSSKASQKDDFVDRGLGQLVQKISQIGTAMHRRQDFRPIRNRRS